MSFPPPLNATPEPVDSPYYTDGYAILKAAKPKNLDDALRGRICTKTGYWVPGHRLKWVNGKPYLDRVAPTKQIPPSSLLPPGVQ